MEGAFVQIKKMEFSPTLILIKTLISNFYAAYCIIYAKSQVPIGDYSECY
jgi:hypothetical protein